MTVPMSYVSLPISTENLIEDDDRDGALLGFAVLIDSGHFQMIGRYPRAPGGTASPID
jgi:hypothetical protein